MTEHDEYDLDAARQFKKFEPAVHNPLKLSAAASKYRNEWTGFCNRCQLPNGPINCAGPDACGCRCHEDYGGIL